MTPRALAPWLVSSLLAGVAAPARAEAFTVQVLAATELQVEPRLAPDRSSLALRVRLQDDRGRAVAGREVTLQLVVDGVAQPPVELALGADGEATHTLALTRAQRVVEARARYDGDGRTAPQDRAIRVGLNLPYVTADVVVPSGGVELGGSPALFVVALHVGEVVDFSPRDAAVELREGDRLLASGLADATGRAVLRVPTAAFPEARVYRVRAVTSVDGARVEGAPRDVLVRTRTIVSLTRAADASDPPAPVPLVGTLTTVTNAPIADAPVRVLRGTVTVAGARTDAAGGFQVRLPGALLAEHGVTVRAVFAPTEPWFAASESAELVLTGPAPRRIHWAWVLTPLLVASGVVAAAAARARWRGARTASPPAPASLEGVVRVERPRTGGMGGLRVRFAAVDRATGRPVADVCVRWSGNPEWTPVGEPLAMQPARQITFEVGATGYSPRRVTGEFVRPGEYVVHVQLRTWREELFERARPWLRRAPGASGLPTLREALAARAATPAASAFVDHIERGCYAPDPPTAREIHRADELAGALDTEVPTLRR